MSLLKESLMLGCELDDKLSIASVITELGYVADAQRQPARAAQLLGAAEALRSVMGISLSNAERIDYDRRVSALCTYLGEETFSTAWAMGQAMTLEQAIAYALDEHAGGK
jgi:non-specific serine/threonine protein kinase